VVLAGRALDSRDASCHGRKSCDDRDIGGRGRCVYPRNCGNDDSRLGPRNTFGQRRRRGAFDPTTSQRIDALFTDIYLKDSVLGGCELAHQAIALRPELRVLYTTGNFVTDKMKALFVKGTQCLCKPYTQLQLQGCFAAMLAA
jgi:hypothetical protein